MISSTITGPSTRSLKTESSGSPLSRPCITLTRRRSPNCLVGLAVSYIHGKQAHFYLAKVGAAPSANIFTNKEYEMLLRSLSIRRLSYVLFSGEKNAFLTQLPTIQEKLVDVFRSVPSPVVQAEVFLCIRILLCRLSPHNLTSFWPVLLTELVGLRLPRCPS